MIHTRAILLNILVLGSALFVTSDWAFTDEAPSSPAEFDVQQASNQELPTGAVAGENNRRDADAAREFLKQLEELDAFDMSNPPGRPKTKPDESRDTKWLKKLPKLTGQHYGLEGYCPVTLRNQQRWEMGHVDHRVEYGGCVLLFAGAKEKKAFDAEPLKYAPVMAGYDPVLWFNEHRAVVGRRRHGLFVNDDVVLFTSEENLRHFLKHREDYSTEALRGASEAIIEASRKTARAN